MWYTAQEPTHQQMQGYFKELRIYWKRLRGLPIGEYTQEFIVFLIEINISFV